MGKFLKPALGIAALCTGLMMASSASAAIVCNRDGDCWHVKGRYAYRPEFGLVVHPNNWRWGVHDRFRWREPVREERGYWRGGVWIHF
jgi:hypothetical protein